MTLTKKISPAKKLAEAHWAWLESTLGKVYKDAFVHGYGHGMEDEKNGEQDAH